MNSKQLSGII